MAKRDWLIGIGLALLAAIAIQTARADVPPPVGPPTEVTAPEPAPAPPSQQFETPRTETLAPLVVRRDPRADHFRIIIPRKYLPAAVGGGHEGEEASLKRRTAVAGVILSTVIGGGFLGVVFLRRRKFGWAATTAVMALALAVGAPAALADLLPGPPPRPPVQVVPGPLKSAPVALEVTEAGDEVILVIGRRSPPIE